MCEDTRHGKGNSCRCGGGAPLEKFMQPCLLLLLKQRSAHGYDLIQSLLEFGFGERSLDPGTVYRNLRRLEDEGLVSSRWDIGEGGRPSVCTALLKRVKRCCTPGRSTSASSASGWTIFWTGTGQSTGPKVLMKGGEIMRCSHDQVQRGHHHGGCCCTSGTGGKFHRRFLSKDEQVARLEAYFKDLQAEAKAVEGKIKEIKGGA